MRNNAKLAEWQDRLAQADRAYSAEVNKMDRREEIYNGAKDITPIVKKMKHQKAAHVQNIVFENIESEVSTSIPQPKVTPVRKEDEHLADIIERFLRNELDRLPFETINDMQERTVPIQGGCGYLIDWDNSVSTHDTVGAVNIIPLHPKQFAPQPGVYTGIEDMDWFILKIPTTKAAIKRRYGKSVYDESESEPDIRSAGAEATAEDAVTQYIGYARNESGGIDRYSWVNDVELEDLKNYQARRQPVCKQCGRVKPLPGQLIYNSVKQNGLLPDPKSGFAGGLIPEDILNSAAGGRMLAGGMADEFMSGNEPEGIMSGMTYGNKKTAPEKYNGGACPWCGSEDFTDEEQEFEEVMLPMETAGGVNIPGATPMIGPDGQAVMQPTLVPFYKPDAYPIVLQKSVSVYGQLLGSSDVDIIADQQNTLNVLNKKIIDRICKAGTRITLPSRADLRIDPEDEERWYLDNPADRQMIGTYDFTGNLQYELTYASSVYEQARNILGITDSFQGRNDRTATSGKAKEFAAAQSAGRLESRRVMKNAAYQEIFKLMFKFWLAYGDEPRPIHYKDESGKAQYEEFSRYDFLLQDEQGNYYWNDQFTFSCDTTEPLANNREAMWQEMRLNLQSGAYGNPQELETLIMFWGKMEAAHYPTAAETKKQLEDRLEQQQQMMQQQQAMMAQQAMMGGMAPQGAPAQPAGPQGPMM